MAGNFEARLGRYQPGRIIEDIGYDGKPGARVLAAAAEIYDCKLGHVTKPDAYGVGYRKVRFIMQVGVFRRVP